MNPKFLQPLDQPKVHHKCIAKTYYYYSGAASSSPLSITTTSFPGLPCPPNRVDGSTGPDRAADDRRRHRGSLRCSFRRRPLPGLPASLPPAAATAAAAAPDVLGRPVPRDRADHRLQEPQPAARADQEDHEGRRGRAHDRRRGPRGLRQGLRDVHPRAHAPVLGPRRGEQAPHLAEE